MREFIPVERKRAEKLLVTDSRIRIESGFVGAPAPAPDGAVRHAHVSAAAVDEGEGAVVDGVVGSRRTVVPGSARCLGNGRMLVAECAGTDFAGAADIAKFGCCFQFGQVVGTADGGSRVG